MSEYRLIDGELFLCNDEFEEKLLIGEDTKIEINSNEIKALLAWREQLSGLENILINWKDEMACKIADEVALGKGLSVGAKSNARIYNLIDDILSTRAGCEGMEMVFVEKYCAKEDGENV